MAEENGQRPSAFDLGLHIRMWRSGEPTNRLLSGILLEECRESAETFPVFLDQLS
jgi:hypothetical protein